MFLRPGQWWFGSARQGVPAVSTVLGSCIGVTLWHRRLKLGGMCHFVLPRRTGAAGAPDGRYGAEALDLLLGAAARAGASPDACAIGVYGGANMFAGTPAVTIDVGWHNAEFALHALQALALAPEKVDVLGEHHRHVKLCLRDGRVALRAGAARSAQGSAA